MLGAVRLTLHILSINQQLHQQLVLNCASHMEGLRTVGVLENKWSGLKSISGCEDELKNRMVFKNYRSRVAF